MKWSSSRRRLPLWMMGTAAAAGLFALAEPAAAQSRSFSGTGKPQLTVRKPASASSSKAKEAAAPKPPEIPPADESSDLTAPIVQNAPTIQNAGGPAPMTGPMVTPVAAGDSRVQEELRRLYEESGREMPELQQQLQLQPNQPGAAAAAPSAGSQPQFRQPVQAQVTPQGGHAGASQPQPAQKRANPVTSFFKRMVSGGSNRSNSVPPAVPAPPPPPPPQHQQAGSVPAIPPATTAPAQPAYAPYGNQQPRRLQATNSGTVPATSLPPLPVPPSPSPMPTSVITAAPVAQPPVVRPQPPAAKLEPILSAPIVARPTDPQAGRPAVAPKAGQVKISAKSSTSGVAREPKFEAPLIAPSGSSATTAAGPELGLPPASPVTVESSVRNTPNVGSQATTSRPLATSEQTVVTKDTAAQQDPMAVAGPAPDFPDPFPEMSETEADDDDDVAMESPFTGERLDDDDESLELTEPIAVATPNGAASATTAGSATSTATGASTSAAPLPVQAETDLPALPDLELPALPPAPGSTTASTASTSSVRAAAPLPTPDDLELPPLELPPAPDSTAKSAEAPVAAGASSTAAARTAPPTVKATAAPIIELPTLDAPETAAATPPQAVATPAAPAAVPPTALTTATPAPVTAPSSTAAAAATNANVAPNGVAPNALPPSTATASSSAGPSLPPADGASVPLASPAGQPATPAAIAPANALPAGTLPGQPTPEEYAAKMQKIRERDGMKGLKGFCPVMLREERELKDAQQEFQSNYRGQKFHFSSDEARAKFDSNPARYAPAAYGADVVVLIDQKDVAEGTLDYAAWFQGQLYLFASDTAQETFMANPAKYATPAELE
jgi:YHS domain-containing protein